MPLHVYLHLVGVCLLRAVQSPRHPLQLLRAVLAGLHVRLDHTLGYTLYSRQEGKGQWCWWAGPKGQTTYRRCCEELLLLLPTCVQQGAGFRQRVVDGV